MKKQFLAFISVVVFLSSILYPQHGAAASKLDEINQAIRELEKQKNSMAWQQRQTSQQLKQIKHNKNQAQQDLNYILNVMDQVSADMNTYQDKIDTTTGNLQQAGQQLDDATKRVAERDQLLRDKLRLMYTNGFVKYVDVLLNANSFADFLDRFNSLTMIVSQDKDILQAQKKDRDLIAAKKQEIESDLSSLKELYAKMESKKQDLLEQEKKKDVLIASLGDQQDQLEEISAEQEQQVIDLAAKVSKLNKEKRNLLIKSDGKLIYPLPQIYPVTSPFGYRIDPITGRRGAFHNGIDIGAPGGTDVLAAADGVVLVAGWYGGFGNCVIIDHGDGLWTLYGHMRTGSLKVKKDDMVKKGQVIGDVGRTGRATGNHLHFTVYENQKAVSPTKYVRFN